MLPKQNTLEKGIKIKHLLIFAAVICIGILLYYGTTILLEKHDQKIMQETAMNIGIELISQSKQCKTIPIIINTPTENITDTLVSTNCLPKQP